MGTEPGCTDTSTGKTGLQSLNSNFGLCFRHTHRSLTKKKTQNNINMENLINRKQNGLWWLKTPSECSILLSHKKYSTERHWGSGPCQNISALTERTVSGRRFCFYNYLVFGLTKTTSLLHWANKGFSGARNIQEFPPTPSTQVAENSSPITRPMSLSSALKGCTSVSEGWKLFQQHYSAWNPYSSVQRLYLTQRARSSCDCLTSSPTATELHKHEPSLVQ